MTCISKVESRKQWGILRGIAAPSFEPVGDRLNRRRPQVDHLSLRPASLAKNPQSFTGRVKVANVQLTNLISSQSIAPQQAKQSIITLARQVCAIALLQNSLKSCSVNPRRIPVTGNFLSLDIP